MTSFGERLRARRKILRMSLRGLSASSGIAVSQLARYEAGAHKPSLDTLVRIADALQTSTDYLMGRPVLERATEWDVRMRNLVDQLPAEYLEIAEAYMALLVDRSATRA